MATEANLTWGQVWPIASLLLGLIIALIGAIWRQHQKEIDALNGHLQRLEDDLDQFRRVELKALQDALNTRMDQLMNAITDLKVDLARHYVPRSELDRLRDEFNKKRA